MDKSADYLEMQIICGFESADICVCRNKKNFYSVFTSLWSSARKRTCLSRGLGKLGQESSAIKFTPSLLSEHQKMIIIMRGEELEIIQY